MAPRAKTMLGCAAAVAALLAPAAHGTTAAPRTPTAPRGVADDRFEAIDGPLGAFVVTPDQFGIDATRTQADVPALLASIDGDREVDLMEALSFPRTASGPEPARQAARDLVSDALTDAGYDPQLESVTWTGNGIDSPNIYAELPGTECPGRTLVIGAHYDSEDPVGGGSDDNATGVAGMVEIARALHDHPLPVTVRFASWSYEEVGLVGAFEMAGNLKAEGRAVVGAVSLEMIGYAEPDIDPLTGLPGDYLAMVADPTSAPLARAFGAGAYTYTPEFAAFGAVIDPNVLPDILRSDHAAFLATGYPALIATDTANFRNPNYHQPTDLPDTIDPDFLEGSTRAALAGLVTVGSIDQDQDGSADACQQSVTTSTTATTTTAAPADDPAAAGAEAIPGQAGYTG